MTCGWIQRCAAAWAVLAWPAAAGVFEKANNALPLSDPASWTNSAAPGTGDVAQWSAVVTGANAVALGSNAAWSALRVTNPGGPVTILPGNTLTLTSGSLALDLASATRDLTLSNALAVTTDQTWRIAAGRTVSVAGAVSATGARVTRDGGGVIRFSQSATFREFYQSGGGTTEVAAGTLQADDWFRVANYGSGVVNVRGGTLNVGDNLMVAYGQGGVGGTLVLWTNGNANAFEVRVCQANTGRVILAGGQLTADHVMDAGGTSDVTFDGGILRARASTVDFFEGLDTARVSDGGAFVDSQGYSVTLAQALTHDAALGAAPDGGLAKRGSGTLTLAGVNTYTGPTVASNGTLAVDGRVDGTGAVTVCAGATLGGTGVLAGAVTVRNGATLAPAAAGTGALRTGPLTLASNAVLRVVLGAPGAGTGGVLQVTGDLVLDGSIRIVDGGGLAAGATQVVLRYTGALTVRAARTNLQSEWTFDLDTNTAGLVKLRLARPLPYPSFLHGDLAVAGTSTNLTVTLHGATSHPMWYEVRDEDGRLWDQGAHAASDPWPFTARHLREGTNTVSVFTRSAAGDVTGASVRLVLTVGANPTVRPRPWPAEVWWGGSVHSNLYVGGSIAGTFSRNEQLLNTNLSWDYVKRHQDGFFLHGYVWVNNQARMTNWPQVGRGISTQLAPYRVRYWLEDGFRPDANNTNYGHSAASGQISDVTDLAGVGLVLSEITEDYNPMIRDVCERYPTWPERDLMALGTGDTNGVSPSYPYQTGQWRDYLRDFRAARPELRVAWTWSPVYFHWQVGPALADSLIFTVSNRDFSFDFYDFMVSARLLGDEYGSPFAFASDCPWGWYGAWGDVTARLANRKKIRDYETWLQTNGLRHTLICNDATSWSPSDPDGWDRLYKTNSLKMLTTHQLEGGRALRYLFESWYAGPFTLLPEDDEGTYANLAQEAIRFLKGLRDPNGAPDAMAIGDGITGLTNRLYVYNNGGLYCLPALVAFESGSTAIVTRYYTIGGSDITARIRSPEGYTAEALVSPGQTLSIRVVHTVSNAPAGASKSVSIEAYWNPQDPAGLVRDRETWTVANAAYGAWQSADVGAVGLAGATAFNAWNLALTGSGADIWGTNDAFRFAWQLRPGDGVITAKLMVQSPTDPWAKAGVMIRESLAPGARHAMMVLTPANGVSFQRRTATNSASAHTTTNLVTAAPVWLRMTRDGSLFTGSVSTNGTSWTTIGSATISSFAATSYWGLAVTSHDNAERSGADFFDVVLNAKPVLADPPDTNLVGGAALAVTNVASDFDTPAQTLTYGLVSAPTGATLNASSGLLAWRPAVAVSPTTAVMTLRVTDNGDPVLSATQSFAVAVARPVPPTLSGLYATGNLVRFRVDGDRGPDYLVQALDDFADWSTLFTSNAPPTPFVAQAPAPTSTTVRFLRVLLGP